MIQTFFAFFRKNFFIILKCNQLKIKSFVIVVIIWLSLVSGLTKKGPLIQNPMGTVFVQDSVYIDKQPIRVRDYLEFLADIRNSYTPKLHDSINKLPIYNLNPNIAYHLYDSLPMDSIFYNKMLTKCWQVLTSDRRIYSIDYHLTGSTYINYPIVNINYYQVFEYCKWRSDKLRIYYAVKNKTLRQRKKYPINFKYRAVKREEWETALSTYFEDVGKLSEEINNGLIDNTPKPYDVSKNKNMYYESTNAAEYLDGAIATVGFNWNGKYGIGNVKYIVVNKPMDWLTFRCACEILPDTVNKPVEIKQKNEKEEKTPKIKEEKTKKKKGIKVENLKR